MFAGDAIDRLRQHFARVAGDFAAELMAMNGESDPVHLRVQYPPKVAVASLVRSLKGVSSRMLRQQRPDMKRHDLKDQRWSPSYFAASCSGVALSIIQQYVEQQQRPS